MSKRRANKYFFKRNKDGSITFRNQESLSQSNNQVIKEQTEVYRDLIYQEVLDDVKKQTDIIARDVLKREFNFGKTRQDRFIDGFTFQVDCISEKYVTLEEIEQLNEGEIE